MQRTNPTHRKRPTPTAVYKDVKRRYIVASLRRMLGLNPSTPAPGEQAAAFCVVPAVVTDLDIGAWLAWCIAGLGLFSQGLPALAIAHEVTTLTVLTHTMLRVGGNLSVASRLTGTTRKILRENLRRLEIYEWAVELRGVMGKEILPDHHPLVASTIQGARVKGADDV